MVKTRTVVQTRTHAQKYFQKVSKGGSRGRICDDIEIDSDDDESEPIPNLATASNKLVSTKGKQSHDQKYLEQCPGKTSELQLPIDSRGVHYDIDADINSLLNVRKSHITNLDIGRDDYFPFAAPYSELFESPVKSGKEPVIRSGIFMQVPTKNDETAMPPFSSLSSSQAYGKRKWSELSAAHLMVQVGKTTSYHQECDSSTTNSSISQSYPQLDSSATNSLVSQQYQHPRLEQNTQFMNSTLNHSEDSLHTMEDTGLQMLAMMKGSYSSSIQNSSSASDNSNDNSTY